MRKLVSANFSRLFHSVIFWLGLSFMFGLAAFAVSMRFRDVLLEPEYVYPTADGLWFVGGMYIVIVLAVFISIWIGTDYSDGTVRNKLMVGHTRGEIYAANWLVCTAAALMMHIIYIVTVAGLGYLLLDPFETPVRTLVLCSLASIATVIAMSSLFLLIAMLVRSKSTGAVAAMITALVLMFGVVTIFNKLNQPEYMEDYRIGTNGEIVLGDPVPNPSYVRGIKRQIFVFITDFSPVGQMIQYGNGDDLPENLVLFPWYSLMITVTTSVGGWLLFRRKDLK